MSPRQRSTLTIAIIGLLAGTAAITTFNMERPNWEAAAPDDLRLLIAPFRIEPSLKEWRKAHLEESLALLISSETGLIASPRGSSKDADYMLEASIQPDARQVMVTLQLRPPAQRAATWTATFWRPREPDSNVSRDFAAAVSSAMRTYMHGVNDEK